MKRQIPTIWLVAGMIAIGISSRLLPHWHNFTAVGAMGIFGAAYLSKKIWSYLTVIIILFSSNLILDNLVYSHYFEHFVWFTQSSIWVYAGFLIMVLLGHILLKKVRISNLLIVSIFGSVLFFLVTNFGVWMQGTLYPKTGSGLLISYTAGLPFLPNTLIANVMYCCLFFGLYEYYTKGSLKPMFRFYSSTES
jgi:hypothetical protein